MSNEIKMQHHHAAALREALAASRASRPSIAEIHYTLADLHRYEAKKLGGMHETLQPAFGDQQISRAENVRLVTGAVAP